MAVCLGTFMLLLDVTIVNVALPDIQRSLHASFSDLQWVVAGIDRRRGGHRSGRQSWRRLARWARVPGTRGSDSHQRRRPGARPDTQPFRGHGGRRNRHWSAEPVAASDLLIWPTCPDGVLATTLIDHRQHLTPDITPCRPRSAQRRNHA